MASTWSEDEFERKWDRCFTDTVLKFGGGILIGGVFSVLFFRGRRWPMIIGPGFGLGMAYSNCQKDINASIIHCKPKEGKPEDEKK